MNNTKHKLIIGSLLHDVGKINYRALNLKMIKSHSIAGYEWLYQLHPKLFNVEELGSMIKYHHYNKMPNYGKDLKEEDLAFLVSIADHISAGADRRKKGVEEEGFDIDYNFSQTNITLESIFSQIKPISKGHYGYEGRDLGYSSKIVYPELNKQIKDSEYNQILTRLNNLFKNEDIFTNSKNINSLVSIVKVLFKYLPSDTRYQMTNDISLAEHSLTTSAFSSSLYDYFQENNITNYYEVWKNENKIFKENTFLFASFDFSGIQKFVFDVPVEGALRNLRVRSFYLEMLAEILVDQILQKLELSRANIIYVGGGHGYLLLPNTKKAVNTFEETVNSINDYLLREFDYKIYLAKSFLPVSANDLISQIEEDSFLNVMGSTFKNLSNDKQNKYNNDIINKLNSEIFEQNERECSICGKSNKLVRKDGKDICDSCLMFLDFSRDLVDEQKKYYVLVKNKLDKKNYLEFPYFDKIAYLYALNKNEFISINDENIIFSYVKNNFEVFEKHATNIFIADYAIKDKYQNQLPLDKIAQIEEKGINRIAVMKLDIDSLGEVFKKGFDPKLYTISRMTSLSSHLSMFFKYYINELLEGYNITVIFSGGDDAFLVGTFNDILKFSKKMYESFNKYTLNKIKYSASISLFPPKYPIYKIADYMEELLIVSKLKEGKSSVTIFDESQTFKWEDFLEALDENSDLSDFKLVDSVIKEGIISNTMLYNRIYSVLKNLKPNDKKTTYNFAYMLGRRKKELNNLSDYQSKLFQRLTEKLFKTSNYQNKDERAKFLLAIQVHIYLNRNK